MRGALYAPRTGRTHPPAIVGRARRAVAPRRRRPRTAAAAAGADALADAGGLLLPPLPDLSAPALGLGAAAATAAVLTAGSLALAAAASGRVDFATTARLAAVIRPGGSATDPRSVLFLAPPDKSATRGLFLLPDRVSAVTVVGPGLDEAWWTQAGAQAGVTVRTLGSLEALAGLPAGSFDGALVRGDVLGALSGADPSGRARSAALRSIAQALAPGAAAVIVERLAGGGPLAGLVRLAGRAPGPGLAEADLTALLEGVTTESGPAAGGKVKASSSASAGYARVALDVVAGGLSDPTAVVVAVTAPSRSGGVAASPPPPAAAVQEDDPGTRAIEDRVRGGGGSSRKKGGGGKKGGFGGG
jgi:hypothetical protein